MKVGGAHRLRRPPPPYGIGDIVADCCAGYEVTVIDFTWHDDLGWCLEVAHYDDGGNAHEGYVLGHELESLRLVRSAGQ